MVPEEDSEASH